MWLTSVSYLYSCYKKLHKSITGQAFHSDYEEDDDLSTFNPSDDNEDTQPEPRESTGVSRASIAPWSRVSWLTLFLVIEMTMMIMAVRSFCNNLRVITNPDLRPYNPSRFCYLMSIDILGPMTWPILMTR